MKNAYFAICYVCNENCLFCPCSKVEKSEKMITDIAELRTTVDSLVKNDVTDVTISGGEPTLHPNLLELVGYMQDKELNVTILSNSERFSDKEFTDEFTKSVDIERIKIITTLHSHKQGEHEKANRTKGSFVRSVAGLLNLSNNGIRVIIKHCITRKNYKNLKEFYVFCDKTFLTTADIQLCSIDYCGIPKDELKKEVLSFIELRPYLEQLFDYHIEHKNMGTKRHLYCINMPLCVCDVFYWNYLTFKQRKMYNAYKDPHNKDPMDISDNVGIDEIYCKNCKAKLICSGTYHTAFSAFGDSIIKPFT